MNKRSRVALVTGASGGIGRAIVQIFAVYGWYVLGVDREAFPGEFPGHGLFLKKDITDPGDMAFIFENVHAVTEKLDALVNNAAISVAKPLLSTSLEEWDAIMTANLRSVFMGIKLAYPLMKAAGHSAIVNVSSVHAVATSANIAAYAASKGGLLAFTRALAIEFAPDNIRVNAILPGAVNTKMLHAGLVRDHAGTGTLSERLENLANKTVMGRIGEPEEIAHAVYFLADEVQSSFMTGQALIVDGGATARLSTE
jgi:glucose 1-dehydrogenase